MSTPVAADQDCIDAIVNDSPARGDEHERRNADHKIRWDSDTVNPLPTERPRPTSGIHPEPRRAQLRARRTRRMVLTGERAGGLRY
jgi:hypothetical protein